MRRSKLRIIMDILFLIQKKDGKAKITHILYGANLSYSSLTNYLDSLTSKGFLEEIKENKHTFYKLTEKGYNYINELRKVERLTDAFGISV